MDSLQKKKQNSYRFYGSDTFSFRDMAETVCGNGHISLSEKKDQLLAPRNTFLLITRKVSKIQQ